MKKFIFVFLFMLLFSAIASATIWVSGYTRSDGTQVQSYERSTPSEPYTVKGEWKGF